MIRKQSHDLLDNRKTAGYNEDNTIQNDSCVGGGCMNLEIHDTMVPGTRLTERRLETSPGGISLTACFSPVTALCCPVSVMFRGLTAPRL